MSIVFLIPTPPPVLTTAEAYLQEIKVLVTRFGGRVVYINPNNALPRHFPVQIPRPFFGWHRLPALWRAGRSHQIYQIYSPTPYPYPVLSRLRRPVVFTLTGSAGDEAIDASFFNCLAAVTVPDDGSLERMRAAGVENAHRVRSGIETHRFSHHPVPLEEEIQLLMASAPWTVEQFHSKGVDALLDAAEAEPRLRLTLLWRGVLRREIQQRIRVRRLEDRVRVIDELADVSEVLAEVHATINLATHGGLVKAYPHSLMESLAAGKPVLVSRAIPMAAEVEAGGCGMVVEEVSAESLLVALRQLLAHYSETQSRAVALGQREFSSAAMIESFAAVYATIPSWMSRPGREPMVAEEG